LRDYRFNQLEKLYPFVLKRQDDVVDMGTVLARDCAIGEDSFYFFNKHTGFSERVADIVERHLTEGLSGYCETVTALNLQIRSNGVKPLEELPGYDDNGFHFVGGICLLPETVVAIEAMNAEIADEERKLKASFWGEWLSRKMVRNSIIESFFPTKGMKFANMIDLLRSTIASLQETFIYKSPTFKPYPSSEMMKGKK
jgi:hypothetical protein